MPPTRTTRMPMLAVELCMDADHSDEVFLEVGSEALGPQFCVAARIGNRLSAACDISLRFELELGCLDHDRRSPVFRFTRELYTAVQAQILAAALGRGMRCRHAPRYILACIVLHAHVGEHQAPVLLRLLEKPRVDAVRHDTVGVRAGDCCGA